MPSKIYTYPVLIKEGHLDAYGHVNDAVYMELFEEARWDFITKNGYGFKQVMETGLGPVSLEATLRYQRELQLREEIVIESCMTSYTKKIGKLSQKMRRGKDVCCSAEFTLALFNLKERKLVLPTPARLQGVGRENP